MNKLLIPKQIVTVNPAADILTNSAVEISGNIISGIVDLSKYDLTTYNGEINRFPGLTLIPGFVQTHIHLCQTLFRGLADDLELLDWLRQRIFPFESAHNKESMRLSVQVGIHELQCGGTTTIMDMGSLNHQEIIFEEIAAANLRAFAGKCLIDKNNLYPKLKETCKDGIKSSYELAKNFHNTNAGRIKYAFSPRFALSCSPELIKESKEMMKDFPGSMFHTHSSENLKEVQEVRRQFNKSNIGYFDSLGVLDDNSLLAHCIHIDDDEISLLKNNKAQVSHCPSSNLKLGSGIADIPKYIKNGINISLGADGAPCNNNLSIFNEMKLAALIQKPGYGPTSMDAFSVFKLATIEGAKALHLENEIGSIEAGKKTLTLYYWILKSRIKVCQMKKESVYSSIVYSASNRNVVNVMVDGNWVVESSRSVLYDEKKLFFEAKNELEKLLQRTDT